MQIERYFMTIYKHILNKKDKGEKLFAVLIDPDKQNEKSLMNTIEKANHAKVDLFLIGGSILKKDTLVLALNFELTLNYIVSFDKVF